MREISIKLIISYADIMFYFPPKIRYFAEIEAAGGAVFCAYDSGEPAGVICLKKQVNSFDAAYLYVKETFRGRGIAKAMTEHAAEYAIRAGKALRLRVLENSEAAPALLKIAQKLQMRPDGEMTFFRLDVTEETKRAWEEYRPRAIELIARLEKRTGNLSVVSFAEADDILLNALREKIGSTLPGLDPFTLPDLDPDFSFIMVRDGESVAFNAVRTIGRKMVYEISAAQSGKGTLMAITPRFFDKLFSSDIERVSCMVYGSNQEGLNHAGKRFGFLFKESGRQTVYVTEGNSRNGVQ